MWGRRIKPPRHTRVCMYVCVYACVYAAQIGTRGNGREREYASGDPHGSGTLRGARPEEMAVRCLEQRRDPGQLHGKRRDTRVSTSNFVVRPPLPPSLPPPPSGWQVASIEGDKLHASTPPPSPPGGFFPLRVWRSKNCFLLLLLFLPREDPRPVRSDPYAPYPPSAAKAKTKIWSINVD